ncbi:hypothetical protein ACDX78_10330 [Virgibacillus oceani]
MSEIINIVDKNDGLIASISKENVILHNDYRLIKTYEDEEELIETAYYDGGDQKSPSYQVR